MNDNLILISGKSTTGKSMCLKDLRNPEGVIYLNCENGKKLPFKSNFREYTVTDPLQVYSAIEKANSDDDVHTVVIDSLSYLMDMYESKYVLTSQNTQKAWGDYAQFFKRLMFDYVATSNCNIICTAHTLSILNEAEMVQEVMVKVKGALMNQGIESYFSTVISTKKVLINSIDEYVSDYMNITDDEALLEYKYCFQTKLTKATINERIRSPLHMWANNETYIDNNLQFVFDRLHEYYS